MQNNESYNELRTNTKIFGISNLGIKSIAFILAPLYSFYLTTEQYGTMDLVTVIVSLLTPVICVDIYEAVFRYVNDNNFGRKQVLSSALAVGSVGILCLALFSAVGYVFFGRLSIIWYVFIFTSLDIVNTILAQYARGIGKIKIFAVSSILNAATVLGFDIVLLCVLSMALEGWLIAFLLGKVLMLIYLTFTLRLKSIVSVRYVNRSYLAEFMKFCVPLIPTTVMWWIMNISDRFMITYFIGLSATGLYAVANKLPGLLSIVENIFYQAWQVTALNMMNKEERDEFYSSIINKYLMLLIIGVISLLAIIRPFIYYLFDSEYFSSWVAVAPLLIAILFHAMAGILGSFYTVFKETKGALISSASGALANIALNVFAIPRWGMIGAAVTTLIGFCVTFIYRFYDTKKYVTIRISLIDKYPYIVVMAIQTALYYLNTTYTDIVMYLITATVLFINRKTIKKLLFKSPSAA